LIAFCKGRELPQGSRCRKQRENQRWGYKKVLLMQLGNDAPFVWREFHRGMGRLASEKIISMICRDVQKGAGYFV